MSKTATTAQATEAVSFVLGNLVTITQTLRLLAGLV